MHALEVLDRDGWRRPRLPRLGPLHAPAEWAVEFVAQYVVRSYVSDAMRNLARLYARRESQAEPESTERRVLARARIQADRLALGFRGGASGLPTVLIGGAAIPVLASLARQFGTVKPGAADPVRGRGSAHRRSSRRWRSSCFRAPGSHAAG